MRLTAGSDTSGRVRRGGFLLRRDGALAESAYRDGHWVRSTLADALEQAAGATPGRVLVEDDVCRLDCRLARERAHALAQALLSRMEPGSVVSFMLPNWHEAAEIYLGITLAGMVAHPILPSLRESELGFQLRDVGSRMVFIPPVFRRYDYVAMMGRVLDAMPAGPEVVVVRGPQGAHHDYATLRDTPAAQRTLPALDPDAVRLVMYTSGTTGGSKGVLHTHNTLHALMRQIGAHWRVAPGDTFLVPSPISHIGGSIYAFEAPLLLGSRAVLMERWEAEAGLRLAESHGCTHICGATPFLEQLLEAARRLGSVLPSLKLFVCGGASVPPALIRDAVAHFPTAAVTRVYGSTEVPVTTVGCPARDDITLAAETDGRPGIADVRIVASTGAGAGGEIRVRGPQMLAGYLHPGDEDAAFDDDGYYRTGDLGHWRDGCVVVSGRSKDIIIRNGENIAPKEVEDLLLGHPEVAEVAIVGVPDPRTGERACAVVVPAGSGRPDVASLAAFLGDRGVAPFKFPEAVAHWDSLPRNDTGKVLKHVIRQRLLDAAADVQG